MSSQALGERAGIVKGDFRDRPIVGDLVVAIPMRTFIVQLRQRVDLMRNRDEEAFGKESGKT